jgi:hypothetical protein
MIGAAVRRGVRDGARTIGRDIGFRCDPSLLMSLCFHTTTCEVYTETLLMQCTAFTFRKMNACGLPDWQP